MTAIPQRRRKNGASPTLLAFGRQYRRHREAAGLSQDRLGAKLSVTNQYISLVETGGTRCTRDFAAQTDRLLETGTALAELWDDLILDAAYPIWFDWPGVEGDAVALTEYSLVFIPGLLQTPAYAEAVLRGDKIAVDARLKRQEILRKEKPPVFSVLLDEAALHRPAGGPEVMGEQLMHLISLISPKLSIQVIPSSAEHMGGAGAFSVATLADRSEVAYLETSARGFTLSDSETLATLSQNLVELRGLALPVAMSKDLIRRTVEERWT